MKSDKDAYRFVLLFRQFMLINNKTKFSSIELTDISSQLISILKLNKKYSPQYVVLLLNKYGITNVLNKHSKSNRGKLWFCEPLNPQTLKVKINV